MVALIPQDMHKFHDSPSLQFLEAGADVGTGHFQRVRDGFGVQGCRRYEKERVDLGYGAIDAPSRPHLPPMEDELLLDWAEFRHIGYFCLNRNYRISRRLSSRLCHRRLDQPAPINDPGQCPAQERADPVNPLICPMPAGQRRTERPRRIHCRPGKRSAEKDI